MADHNSGVGHGAKSAFVQLSLVGITLENAKQELVMAFGIPTVSTLAILNALSNSVQ